MSSDVAYFTQDYWMNSLAIGHPLVYHSTASSKNTLGNAPAMDDSYVMQWNTMDMVKYETNL
jgi:iron(II)-dependent oxidoreductase